MKKKITAILVAALFIFSAVIPVFAWTSFQDSNSMNNGLISDGGTYLTTGGELTPSDDPDHLTVYTGLNSAAWAGIECSPVINIEGTNNTPYAYILHSSGSVTKLAKVDLTSPSTVPTGWTADGVQVNTTAGFQLSTPVIVNDTIYFAGNVFANVIRNSDFVQYVAQNQDPFTDWTVTPSTGVSYSQSVITLTDNTTREALHAQATGTGDYSVTVQQTGINIPNNQSASIRIAGGLKFTNVSAVTVKVYVNNDLPDNATYVYNTSLTDAIDLVEDNGVYCWNENVEVVSGSSSTVKVEVSFTTTSSDGCVDLDYVELYTQSAGIGKIENISTTTNPVPVGVVGNIVGQINTPISSDGTYLYFGTYTTNGKYYKVKISDHHNCTSFDMTNNSTYWAGAAILGQYLVFGTEKGVLYVLKKSDLSVVASATLTGSPYIRSSICAIPDGNKYKLYFTSRTGSSGTLWCYTLDPYNQSSPLSYNWSQSVGYTNSTPAVSGDYVYVGGSEGVKCFDMTITGDDKLVWSSSSVSTAITSVQASPVVYSVTNSGTTTDYIYVTTNKQLGQCYCISYTHGSTPSLAWYTNITAAEGANFTLQGFAAGGGYLVCGNDKAKVIIIH